MSNKEKSYSISVLFLLAIFQYLNIEKLWGIDFLLLGLLFYAYFISFPWLTIYSVTLILLSFFVSGQFTLLTLISYLFIPFLAKRASLLLSLNFPKYSILCLSLLFIYILLETAILDLGFINFLIIFLKNLIAGGLIFGILRKSLPE